MKVAVSAQGKDLNAMVDPRLGGAQQFLLVDTESKDKQDAVNRCHREHSGILRTLMQSSSLRALHPLW